VRVRPAVAADRAAIWALNDIPNIGMTSDPSFPLDLERRDEPPPQFPDLADVPESFIAAAGGFFVVEDDGRLLGMGGYERRGPDEAQVLRVRVHPARRRRGIGRRLMAAIEEAAAARGIRRLIVETADNQPEAIAFYVALGYRRTGTESHPDWAWTLLWFARDIA
jgi:ribosomal protein S18 acetylase RimI-like enzyme